MICFEEFNPDARYPVVLPCGHTYVCNMCGDRLDKCMECREPLFITMPRTALNNQPANNGGRSAPSYRTPRGVAPPSPPVPPIKRRLPLPKNVVLLSLIEATELATEDASSKPESSPRHIKSNYSTSIGSLDGGSARSLDDPSACASSCNINAEDLEAERIKLGTSMAVSVAGTYAVTDKTGLSIFSSRPSSRSRPAEESSGKQTSVEDVDKLVRHFHLDQKIETGDSTAEEDELKENRIKDQPPARLSCGDRVQVVAIEGRWAKLARGYGYVRADDNKLVKVGSTVDRACKLEAMLRSLSQQRKRLRKEQSKVDNMFIRLMNDLQVSLMTDDDLTVIVADTFAKTAKKKTVQRTQDEARETEPMSPTGIDPVARASSIEADEEDTGPFKPPKLAFRAQQPLHQEQRQDPPGMAVSNAARGFACFANDMFDSISGAGSTDETDFQKLRRQQGLATPVPTVQKISIEAVPSTLFPSASHPSPSAMSAGARAWREKHGRQEEPVSGVDFKTGMSGHMALLSSHAHPHEYLGGRLPNFHGMSNHTGLSITKPIKKSVGALYQSMYQSLYPALTVPSLSGASMGTPERPQQSDSRSDRSDSM